LGDRRHDSVRKSKRLRHGEKSSVTEDLNSTLMKVLLLLLIIICWRGYSQQVVFTTNVVSTLPIGADGSALSIVRRVSDISPGVDFKQFNVGWVPYGSGDIQSLTPVFILFEIEVTNVTLGRRIDSAFPVVRGQQPAQYPPDLTGASNGLGGLLGYKFSIRYDRFGEPYSTNFADVQNETPYLRGLTNAYFAFRQLQADGFHYGWYQVQRSAPSGYVPWYLVDVAVHPVAEEAIRAGLPPPQPVIEAHVIAAVPPETDPGVRLTWPHAYRNYRLERASALESPILWEPVDLVGTNQVSLPLGGSNVFYRLSPP
jgi:hypothetical protein